MNNVMIGHLATIETLLLFTQYGFNNYDTQSLSCSVDASYVEMTCSKNDLTTKAVDITSIYDEIPSEFRVVIWFQTDSGAFPTSYRILLD